jgi:IS30 family transposase
MNYQQLTEGQRYQIALLYKEHCSYREIGQRVDVSKPTVSRDLRRNGMRITMKEIDE